MLVYLGRLYLLMIAKPKAGQMCPSPCISVLNDTFSRHENKEEQWSKLHFCFCQKYHVNLWTWWCKNGFQRSSVQILILCDAPQIKPDDFPQESLNNIFRGNRPFSGSQLFFPPLLRLNPFITFPFGESNPGIPQQGPHVRNCGP